MPPLFMVRWLLVRSTLVVLSTLMVVLPIPFHSGMARADAYSVSAESESFNFSSQSAAGDEGAVESAGANALKQRTSPVSASGAFSTSVSIDVPPGRSGMTPSLGLSYVSDSFRQDSPVGAGWSFGVSSISRDTTEGFPPVKTVSSGWPGYDDDKTLFTGPSGRLIRSTASEGLTVASGAWLFVPEREHSPVRYEYLAAADRWVEHLPSGVKRYYGAADTRQARVKNELGTHEWLLLKERDADGNTIEYDYHFLDGAAGQARSSMERAQALPVLKSVRWGANDVAGLPHVFRIATDIRAYPGQLDMLHGHTLLQGQITAINVYGPLASGIQGERLYWQYALNLTQSGDTFRNLLRSVTRTGFNLETGAAETTPVTKRFTYANNGDASWLMAGAPGANTATRDAYSTELQTLLEVPPPVAGRTSEIYQGGFRLDQTTVNGRPTFNGAQIAQLQQMEPMSQLSPEYLGAGYRFEDLDTDGDLDVLYHPSGLGTPASRVLFHKSYLNEGGAFTRVLPKERNRQAFRGIPGGLLISSMADVDGDSDPDAVAFPLRWANPVSGLSLDDDFVRHYSINDSPFDLTKLGSANWNSKARIIELLKSPETAPGETSCVSLAPIVLFGGNGQVLFNALGALPGLSGIPGFRLPGDLPSTPVLTPVPPVGGGIPPFDFVGTQDPDDQLPNGDPMLDIRFRIDQMLGYCRFNPWFKRLGAADVDRFETKIHVAYNTSRGNPPVGGVPVNDGSREFTVRGWPGFAKKEARWGLEPTRYGLDCQRGGPSTWDKVTNAICTTDIDNKDSVEATWKVLTTADPTTKSPPVLWNAAFVQRSDFHAPLADVNADGRADIVLLKSMDIFAGGTYTNFVPNVYLSNGNGFTPERESSRGLGFDVTNLVPRIDWTRVDFRRAYKSMLRPTLTQLLPGPSLALSPSTLEMLPATQRAEAASILSAFRTQDPSDANVALGLQTALVDTFDRGINARYPAPMASLRNVATEILRNTAGWFGNWLSFSTNLLPDINLDLGDMLMPVNDRVYLSVPSMIRTLRHMGRTDALAPLKSLLEVLKPVVGASVIDDIVKTFDPASGFTSSALQIFNYRDLVCSVMDNYKTCARVMEYPINIDFNAFMFDANGDGLPDMVAAHQPLLLITEEEKEEDDGDDTNNHDRFRRACGAGHQVHLNRGYRWESPRQAGMHGTLPVKANEPPPGQEGWSTDPTMKQAVTFHSSRDQAFSLLNQRTQACTGAHFEETEPRTDNPPAFAGLPMSAASFSDINADGLTDVVFAAVTQGEIARQGDPKMVEQFVFLNTGRGFIAVVTPQPNAFAQLSFDLRLAGNLPWRGLPSDFYMTQYIRSRGTTLGSQDRARLVDVDSDGLLDVVHRGECQKIVEPGACSRAEWRRNMRKVPDLLTRIDEGSGAWTEVDYVSANSEDGRAIVGRSLGAPPTGLMVASQIRSGAQPIANVPNIPNPWKNVGGESVQRIKLTYDNYTREDNGKRALGFAAVAATFAIGLGASFTDISTSTYTYNVAKTVSGTSQPYPLRGSLRSARSLDLTGSGSEQITTYDYLVTALGNAARIRSGRVTTKTKDGALWMASASEPSQFDSLGYPKTFVSGRLTDAGAILTSGPEATTTSTTYKHRTSEWRLGREDTVTTTGDRVSATGGRTTGAGAVLSKTITTYDSAGRVASHAVLQDRGSPCSSSKEQWNITTFPKYNAANLPEQIVDNGTTVTLAYDTSRLYPIERRTVVPASVSSRGATLIEEAEYDPRSGAVEWTRDMNQHVTTRTYDSRGRLLTTSIGIGPDPDDEQLIERHTYSDDDGGPWTALTQTFTTPSSSFKTWSAFDGAGRVLATNKSVAANDSSAIRIARNRYDGLGRQTESYQSATLDVQPGYALTNLTVESGALATLTSYDGFDRVRSTTLPGKRDISYVYDSLNSASQVVARTTTTNPRLFKSVRLYNTRGALLSLQRLNASNAAELAYSYDYDGAGRMVAVQDATSARRVSFDEGGRLRSASLPFASGQTPRAIHSYCYDARGKLAKATTPEGREVIVSRDTLGRVAKVDVKYDRLPVSGGTPTPTTSHSSFFYDCDALEGSLGKMCDRIDDASSTHLTYDLQGRTNRYETTFSDAIADTLPPSISNYYVVQLNYGLAGQLNSSVVEGLGTSGTTRTVSYGRDLLARTNAISVSTNDTAMLPLVTAATYDAFDRLKNVTLGNAATSEWNFDLERGHLVSQRMLRGTTPFAELVYPIGDYDKNGNLGRERHLLNSELASEKVHTYDALDQLATSALTIGTVATKNDKFSYKQGNITTVVGASRTDTYVYDTQNTQAVKTVSGGTTENRYSRTLAYDLDGWVSSDLEARSAGGGLPATSVKRSLTFDAGGCMREANVTETPTGGTARTTTTRNLCGFGASRAYRETKFPDAHIERVYYLPDGSELRPDQNLFVMQLPVATSTVATLAWSIDTGALVQEESGYIHTDMRGSVVARTALNKTADAIKTPDSKAEYGAWGDTIAYAGVKPPRYQFTNEEPDPGTGYYYFGARPYDPTLRRWLAPDPLVMGDLELDANTGTQLNVYSYAANNPVGNTDPTGRFAPALLLLVPPAIDLAIVAVAAVDLTLGYLLYERQAENDSAPTPGAPPPPVASEPPPSAGPSGSPKTPKIDLGPAVVGKLASDSLQSKDKESPRPAVAAAAAGGGDDGGGSTGNDDDDKKNGGPKAGSAGGPGAGKRFSDTTKDAAERQAGGKCVFCSRETSRTPGGTQRNTDHAIPKSEGGNNTLDNAQNTCRDCNLRKGAQTTEEYLEGTKN